MATDGDDFTCLFICRHCWVGTFGSFAEMTLCGGVVSTVASADRAEFTGFDEGFDDLCGAVARAVAETLHLGAVEHVVCGKVCGEACCDLLIGEVLGAYGTSTNHLGATHGLAQFLGGSEGDAAHANVAWLYLVGTMLVATSEGDG